MISLPYDQGMWQDLYLVFESIPKFLDPSVVWFLIFLRNYLSVFCNACTNFAFIPEKHGFLYFLNLSASFCFVLFNGRKVIFHLSLVIFWCDFLWRKSIQIPCSLKKNQIIHFVVVALLGGVPYVLGVLTPYQRYELQIFPPHFWILTCPVVFFIHRFIFWYNPDLGICFNIFLSLPTHYLLKYCSQEIINSLAWGYCLMFPSKDCIV